MYTLQPMRCIPVHHCRRIEDVPLARFPDKTKLYWDHQRQLRRLATAGRCELRERERERLEARVVTCLLHTDLRRACLYIQKRDALPQSVVLVGLPDRKSLLPCITGQMLHARSVR